MSKKFNTLFKPGDIICSDKFYDAKCMIVIEYDEDLLKYKCDDLIIEDQTWAARGRGMNEFQKYEWRLATDDDICNYIAKFIKIEEKVNYAVHLEMRDNSLHINWLGYWISLEKEELEGIVRFAKKWSTADI